MAQSIANKYRRLIIETDEFLRKQHPNGTRVHVDYRKAAEDMNVGASTMSSVLGFLAGISDSGLTRIKGVGGKYEYMLPAGYPEELATLKAELRQQPDPSRKRMSNPDLQADVIAFFKRRPNEVQTISDVAEEVIGNRSSISGCCNRLAKAGWLEARKDLGSGIYIYYSSTIVDPETVSPEDDPEPVTPSVHAAGITRERAAEARVIAGRDATAPEAEIRLTPREVAQIRGAPTRIPSPARVAEVVSRRTEEITDTIVAEAYPPDGEIYEYLQEDKKGRKILRNRETGRLGYWEEM